MHIILLLLSGDRDRFLSLVRGKYPQAEVGCRHWTAFRGKSPLRILKELRSKQGDLFLIGCEDVRVQQKLHILKLAALAMRAKEKLIVDLQGRLIRCSWANFVLVSLPMMLIEFVLSCLLIIAAYLLVPILRWLFFTRPSRKKVRREEPFTIAFLRTNFWFNLHAGGSVTHIAGFTSGINKLGHRLFFISSDKLENIKNKITPVHVIHPWRIFNTIFELPELAYNIKFICKARGILKKEMPHFLYQRHSLLNCSGVILARLLQIPLILEFNSSEAWKGKHWVKIHFLHLTKIVENFTLRGADAIIVVSNALKNQLVDARINEAKIFVNPNGVNAELFTPLINGKSIRSKYNLDERTIVGFASTFGVWHGLTVLVNAIEKAVKANNNLHFLLIGEGEVKDEIGSIGIGRKLEQYVTMTGTVPHRDMPEYLAACDILVSPYIPLAGGSEFFGSPTKLFEYMAMGKGIIASNLGQIGEVLKDDSALLVEPGDSTELAQAILKLAADRELRDKMGKRARERVAANYTWKKNANRVIRVYKNLAGSEADI